MRGLLVLACVALFAGANNQEQLVKREGCCCYDPPECPLGCCPILDGVCCPNLMWCAATFAECPLCPFIIEIPSNKLCDGAMCYYGCCGNSEGWTCADKPADCPECVPGCPDWLDRVDCP
eukprot:TRINITY_DN19242_c0_g1_i1.p1 TRINITY_DN19242_c0_g1~~TRINITY_DN19242_c0_g1_i1.p1  ORF type:complete len:120 (-),score=19.75 TRINITY_DN19242_c0_g1_i1:152-511(-)